MSKQIPLSQGKFAIVDDDDFDAVNSYSWHSYKVYNNFYARRSEQNGRKISGIRMHRQILKAKTGDVVDHINGNGLDNRKCNLRICTNSDNIKNMSKPITNTSGYKGVSWEDCRYKWKVKISVNRKQVHIGYFNCLIKAAKAYNKAAIKYHGKFARLNIF